MIYELLFSLLLPACLSLSVLKVAETEERTESVTSHRVSTEEQREETEQE